MNAPLLPLHHLDTLWLQVTGTRCNIACRHCLVSAGPKVDLHPLMSVAQVATAIEEAAALGCRTYAFTGGEPFLHPQILELIDLGLAQGPLEILTNGMCFTPALAQALGERFRASEYSLGIRVSLDGLSPLENDPIRGPGVFAATTAGIRLLVAHGLEPILAVTTVHAAHAGAPARAAFLALLRELGVTRPRLKLIPPFRVGREARREQALLPEARITADMLDADSPWILQCGSGRTVTARGVWPCPILINHPGARLGDRLADSLGPCALSEPACHTCWVEGFTCSS